MTKEEAIKHLHTYSSTNGSGLTTQDQHEEAKKMAIKALETQLQWIPCSERLPTDFEEVLAWYEYFRYGKYNRMYQTYGVGYYNSEFNMWGGGLNGRKLRVFAWMPLPEPYSPEGEEHERSD